MVYGNYAGFYKYIACFLTKSRLVFERALENLSLKTALSVIFLTMGVYLAIQ